MIKLSKLPDRTPVKVTIHLPPELNDALIAYGALYRETYGLQAGITDLIPSMLKGYLDSDRTFSRGYRKIGS